MPFRFNIFRIFPDPVEVRAAQPGVVLFCHIAHTSCWPQLLALLQTFDVFPLGRTNCCGVGFWPYCFVLGDSLKQNYTHERHGNGKLVGSKRCQKRKLQASNKTSQHANKSSNKRKQTKLKPTPKSVGPKRERERRRLWE